MNDQKNDQPPRPTVSPECPARAEKPRPAPRQGAPGRRQGPNPYLDFLFGFLASFLLILVSLFFSLDKWMILLISPNVVYLTSLILFLGILAAVAARRQYIALGILATPVFVMMLAGSCMLRLFF